MSFLSEHIAQQTDQPEPVAGPNSPHFDAAHHYQPEQVKNTGRVVMAVVDGRHVEVNEHPELERQRAETAADVTQMVNWTPAENAGNDNDRLANVAVSPAELEESK